MGARNQIISLIDHDETRSEIVTHNDSAPRGPGPKPGLPVLHERVLAPGEIPPPAQVVGAESLPPMAGPARIRSRHNWLFASFCCWVFIPVVLAAAYLFLRAEDQFASTTGFTVQREEGASASDLLGGLAAFGGPGGTADADVLYEYIQSQEIVERIDAQLSLRDHYSQPWRSLPWAGDFAFSIWPDASVEDLVWFWKRVIRVSFDQSAGLIEVEVRAFDPRYARAVADAIVAESERRINLLAAQARADATRLAQADLDEALERLKSARQALTSFRSRTRIVDPMADLEGRFGVMSNLQQQLAEALIRYDLLLETTTAGDQRLEQAELRIDVIRARIASEREGVASGTNIENGQSAFPALLAEYERLSVDREFAEETYRAALAAFDLARAKAQRQSRYLATYITPTLAESAEYPRRYMLLGAITLFLTLSWVCAALIFYSVRDRG